MRASPAAFDEALGAALAMAAAAVEADDADEEDDEDAAVAPDGVVPAAAVDAPGAPTLASAIFGFVCCGRSGPAA